MQRARSAPVTSYVFFRAFGVSRRKGQGSSWDPDRLFLLYVFGNPTRFFGTSCARHVSCDHPMCTVMRNGPTFATRKGMTLAKRWLSNFRLQVSMFTSQLTHLRSI